MTIYGKTLLVVWIGVISIGMINNALIVQQKTIDIIETSSP